MKTSVLLVALFVVGEVSAQLDVPVRLVLEGSAAEDRQVRGLADPVLEDAAVGVDAARSTTMNRATASGSSSLLAAIVPAPPAYTVGMTLTIVPDAANEAGATLDLNGLGARPIVKWGQVPLDSADLVAGSPIRLIYDGQRFLLLNDLGRPCPAGYVAISSTLCVNDSTQGEGTFFDGIIACEALGARLCSFGEWANACRNRPGFLGTVSAYEWVDDAANNGNDAKTVGGGYDGPNILPGFACEYGYSSVPTATYRYRCCKNR